jgi:hypothetical protein
LYDIPRWIDQGSEAIRQLDGKHQSIIIAPRNDEWVRNLRERMVLHTSLANGLSYDWRVSKLTDGVNNGSPVTVVVADPAEVELADCGPIRVVTPGGGTEYTFAYNEERPYDILTRLVGPSLLTYGIDWVIIDEADIEPQAKLTGSGDMQTSRALIKKIEDDTGTIFDFMRVGNTGYRIRLVYNLNPDAPQARVSQGLNFIDLTRVRGREDLATVIIVRGKAIQGRRGPLGLAMWRVADLIAGGPPPPPYPSGIAHSTWANATPLGHTDNVMTIAYAPPADAKAIVLFIGSSSFGSGNGIPDTLFGMPTLGKTHFFQYVTGGQYSGGVASGQIHAYILILRDDMPAETAIRLFTSGASGYSAVVTSLTTLNWLNLTAFGSAPYPGGVNLVIPAEIQAMVVAGLHSGFSSLSSFNPPAGYTRQVSHDFGSDVQDFIGADALSPGGNVNVTWVPDHNSRTIALAVDEIDEIVPSQDRIRYVAGASAVANTVALPAGWTPGQYAIVTALAINFSVMPDLPAGWTHLDSQAEGTSRCRVAYRILQEGDTDIGVWTNADNVMVVIYDIIGIGAIAAKHGPSDVVLDVFPDLTMTGTNHVLALKATASSLGSGNAFRKRATDMITASDNYTSRNLGAYHTEFPTDTFTGRLQSQSGASVRYFAFALEMIPPVQEPVAPPRMILEDRLGGDGPIAMDGQFVGNGLPENHPRYIPDHYLEYPDGSLHEIVETYAADQSVGVQDEIMPAVDDDVRIAGDALGSLLAEVISPVGMVLFGRVTSYYNMDDVEAAANVLKNPFGEAWATKPVAFRAFAREDHLGDPSDDLDTLRLKNVSPDRTIPAGTTFHIVSNTAQIGITGHPVYTSTVDATSVGGVVDVDVTPNIPLIGPTQGFLAIDTDAEFICITPGPPTGWVDQGKLEGSTSVLGYVPKDQGPDLMAVYETPHEPGVVKLSGLTEGDIIWPSNMIRSATFPTEGGMVALGPVVVGADGLASVPARGLGSGLNDGDPVLIARTYVTGPSDTGVVLFARKRNPDEPGGETGKSYMKLLEVRVPYIPDNPIVVASAVLDCWADGASDTSNPPRIEIWKGGELVAFDQPSSIFLEDREETITVSVEHEVTDPEGELLEIRVMGFATTLSSAFPGWPFAILGGISLTVGGSEEIPRGSPTRLHQDANLRLLERHMAGREYRVTSIELTDRWGLTPAEAKLQLGQILRLMVPELGIDVELLVIRIVYRYGDTKRTEFVLSTLRISLTGRLAKALGKPRASTSISGAVVGGTSSGGYTRGETDVLIDNAIVLSESTARAIADEESRRRSLLLMGG